MNFRLAELTCALIVAVAVPAAAQLKLENLRGVFGPLGPERAWEAAPGDEFTARFTLRKLTRDESGKIHYRTQFKLLDATDKLLVAGSFSTETPPSIPGGEDCAWLSMLIPESALPGKCRLVVEVEDVAGKQKGTLEHELIIADAGLRFARVQLAYDGNFAAAAPPLGYSGQRLFYRATVLGFHRKEGKTALELRSELIDLSAEKPEPHVVSRIGFGIGAGDIARPTLTGSVALHKVGKYSLRLVIADQNSGKEASFTTPLIILEPLGEQAPQGKLVAQPVDAETLAARKLAGQRILGDEGRSGLIASLGDHKSGVGAAVFSPQGKWLATGGDDGLQSALHDWDVRIWDWLERRVVKTLENRLNQTRRLAFSPDGRRLALLTRGGDVLVWEVESGKRVVEWTRDAKVRRKELFLDCIWPDNEQLLLAGPAGLSRLPIAEGKVTESFTHEKEPLFSVAFASEKKQLIAGGRQKMVIFSWPEKESHIVANPTADIVERIDISADGRLVAASRSGQAHQLWNMEAGRLVFGEAQQRGEGALAPSPVALVPGNQWLLTTALSTLRQHRTDNGAVRKSIGLPHRDPAAVAVSPDGKFVAIGTREGPTHLIRLPGDAVTNPIDSERRLAEWLQKINAQFDLASLNGQRINWVPSTPLPAEQFHISAVRFINVAGLTDEGLHNLAAATGLTQVSIAGAPQVTGVGFAPLTVLAQLRMVDLSRSGITGDGLKALVRLPALTTLSINDVALKPEDCTVLEDARSLVTLHLSGVPIKRELLQRIKKMPNLGTLGLVNSDVGDDDLAELAELPQLQSLNLSGTRVTDAGLVHLTKLARLRVLMLANTAVTGEGFTGFPDEQPFSTILLGNTKLKDDALAKVGRFPRLFHLSLSNTPLTDAGLVHLKDSPLLSTLEIHGTEVTGTGLETMSGMPKLSTVLLGNIKATPADIQKFKSSKPRNVIP